MPLIQHHTIEPAGEWGLWKLTELEDYFLEHLDFELGEQAQYEKMRPSRRLEWLAVRWLLHQLSGRKVRGKIRKDEYGKPYLVDSDFQISLSHSNGMAAVIAAPMAVGIDIQLVVEKIERIAHKFMRTEETESLHPNTRLEHLHVYWGAKEALYKAYGRRELDFRQHIHIRPFEYNVTIGQCLGYIVKEDFRADYRIFYKKIDNYILVYCWELSDNF